MRVPAPLWSSSCALLVLVSFETEPCYVVQPGLKCLILLLYNLKAVIAVWHVRPHLTSCVWVYLLVYVCARSELDVLACEGVFMCMVPGEQ